MDLEKGKDKIGRINKGKAFSSQKTLKLCRASNKHQWKTQLNESN